MAAGGFIVLALCAWLRLPSYWRGARRNVPPPPRPQAHPDHSSVHLVVLEPRKIPLYDRSPEPGHHVTIIHAPSIVTQEFISAV